ncbi:MAG: CPBP family intramembrane metalloprotease [Bacteroidia bacterium]|nr:CPBP family intramembrane metalloprotease [Bacteroidia bacterium]
MFLQNAKAGKNEFWRYIVSFFTILAGWQIFGTIPLLAVILIKDPYRLISGVDPLDFAAIGIDINTGLVLILLSFFFGMLGLFISIRFIHQKPIKAVISGRDRVNWNRIFTGAGIWLILLILALIIDYTAHPGKYSFNFTPAAFFPLVIICIIFIPIQTSFEELMFRGYYMQGISLLSKNAWIPLLITSLVFGLLHSFNPEVQEFGFLLTMPQYILFGLLFGVITLLDNGMELALGVHAVNNLFAALFVSHPSAALNTPAMFILTKPDPVFDLWIFLIIVPVFIFIVSSIYKWKDWQRIIFNTF